MSQENVETVRRTFQAFNDRDLDTLLACHTDDVEWRLIGVRRGGRYRLRSTCRSTRSWQPRQRSMPSPKTTGSPPCGRARPAEGWVSRAARAAL